MENNTVVEKDAWLTSEWQIVMKYHIHVNTNPGKLAGMLKWFVWKAVLDCVIILNQSENNGGSLIYEKHVHLNIKPSYF